MSESLLVDACHIGSDYFYEKFCHPDILIGYLYNGRNCHDSRCAIEILNQGKIYVITVCPWDIKIVNSSKSSD
jgi:hypothetical protein